ncbi:DNA translocase FtsK 4TM domain-containing protein [Candidatus Uhrbacteria bacterium]|nr:DNA translocase FtsK 4TM domain-containing protein [Candidatus Uhrbacteria bacterium]
MAREKQKNRENEEERDEQHNEKPPLVDWSLNEETQRGVVVILIVLFGFLALFSLFDLAGHFGRFLDTTLGIFLGWARWIAPFLFFLVAYILYHPDEYRLGGFNILGIVLFVSGSLGLIHVLGVDPTYAQSFALHGEGGGYVGYLASNYLFYSMGFWATIAVLIAATLVGLLIMFNTSLERLLEQSAFWRRWYHALHLRWMSRRYEEQQDGAAYTEEGAVVAFREKSVEHDADNAPGGAGSGSAGEITESEQLPLMPKLPKRRRMLTPPLELLQRESTKPTVTDLQEASAMIQKTLENFGITVEMGDVNVGPTVTQFTLKPAEGVRLAEITALGNDLALALAAHPIRIEAPIPGKSLVGIEVPNQKVAIVPLGEILHSDTFKKRRTNMMLSLGKDVTGTAWMADLTRMPHLLVAGATGSGKSIALNAILLGLLYQNGPDDLKFILVDPKRVELPVYNGIPHLLTPVITDVKKTVNALKWAMTEMERRFALLEAVKCRDIHSYNEQHAEERLPFIVIMIDELADLMVAAAAEVEPAIIRLAQMARAVGIHLIVATQRPSVDIITGLIKANITSRIAFSVASQTDSRTILDTSGAEKLLGRGDMLFISAELSKPKRLQGAFISDAEIQRVTDFLKAKGDPEYDAEIVEHAPTSVFANDNGGSNDSDPMLQAAKECVMAAGKASASLLQRRLRLGYARAARMLDLLEEQGIIGPAEGARPRDVLVPGGAGSGFAGKSDNAPYAQEGENDIVEESTEEREEQTEKREDISGNKGYDDNDAEEILNPKP